MTDEERQAAYEIGQLAWDMVHGYTVHITAIRMGPRLSHKEFVRLIGDHPTDSIKRKDGSDWTFDVQDTVSEITAETRPNLALHRIV